jgi:hypothetical protein
MKITVHKLIKTLRRKNYEVYSKPFQLNIVGIRNAETVANSFDDELHVFFKEQNLQWKHYSYSVTTDPGTYFLKNPLQVNGTAILKEGQYVNTYRLGLHRGDYLALVQLGGKVTVIRDYDRNALLDFFNGTETTGWYGINIHRAKAKGQTKIVDRWSAGCQVFSDVDDFDFFIKLCQTHRLYYGNNFTYTLIDLRAIQRNLRRWWIYGTSAAFATGLVITYLTTKEKKAKQIQQLNDQPKIQINAN